MLARQVEQLEQLLDLSRLDAHAMELHVESLRLRERTAALIGTVAGDRPSEVQLAIPPPLVALLDPTGFDRILSSGRRRDARRDREGGQDERAGGERPARNPPAAKAGCC
jgi:hypothetical protein